MRAARVIADAVAGPIDGAAAALCNVRHPLLLSPIEIVRSARQLAVITEHVEGRTVRSLVKHAAEAGESIPPVIGVRIALDVIEALQALASSEGAAEGSSLYGGLTPDSIHVGEDGVTRLLDPGVAAAAARATRFALHPVLSAYTAPEHIDEGGDFDVRSDVFSLGVLLWETLACRSLFESDDYEQVCERVLHAPIPRVQREHTLRGEPIAAGLASVVARALFRNPELRFQSYEHFASALRENSSIAEHEHVAAFIRGGLPEMATDVPSVPAPKLAAEAARAQSRSETGGDRSTFELLDGEIPIDDPEAAPATAARPFAAPALAAPAPVDSSAPALRGGAHPARALSALLAAPPPAARSLGAPPLAAPAPAAHSLGTTLVGVPAPAATPVYSTRPCSPRARCLRLRSPPPRPQRARPRLRRLRPTWRRSRCPCPRRARRSLRPKRPRRCRTRPALPWALLPSRSRSTWLGLVPAGSFRCSWRC